jgi:large conductance mechanosensitive channel
MAFLVKNLTIILKLKFKPMLKDFKEFVLRGNVVDLAVGVIIGGAFGAIVNSLVADIITPILLQPALKAAGAENIAEWQPGGLLIGKFIASVISFLVIAFVLFILIKGINKATRKKKEEEPVAPAAPPADIQLLTEIRDLLSNK